MAGFDQPNVLNSIFSDVPAINEVLVALAKMNPSTLSALAAQMKRIADGADGYEIQMFNGQSWENIGRLNHDAASVDGFSASQTVQANSIAVRDKDGKLEGDILGNAATATSAEGLSQTLLIPNGGTGGTTAAEARNMLDVAKTNHASASTDYGLGNAAEYGHNKLSDATDSVLGADGGTAATPLAVMTAKEEAITAAGEGLEAFAEAQAQKDASQDAAIESFLDKAILPLGFEYTRLTGQTAPLGGVDYMGQTATRAMYADLWAELNENKPEAIISEEEWQALYSSQNGNVPYYSTGDGSTTFRFPRVVGYFKGAGSMGELGQYTPEGLPGIDGSFDIINHNPSSHSYTGAFAKATVGAMPINGLADGPFWNEGWGTVKERFDASASNSIFDNSPHVTPETITVVMGVIAFGSVMSLGEATEEGIVAELIKLAAQLSEYGATKADASELAKYLPLKGGTMTGALVVDDIYGSEDTGVKRIRASGPESSGINLFGPVFQGYPAVVEIFAQSPSARSIMAMTANGGLTLNGNTVLTSAHGLLMNWDNVAAGTFNGSGVTLPAGGTWAYSLARDEDTTNMGGAGIVAGGTTITTGRAGQHHYFAVRIG